MLKTLYHAIVGIPVSLRSPLTVAECERELHDCADLPQSYLNLSQLLGSKTFIGRLDGGNLSLRVRLRRGFKNSWQYWFKGTLREDGGGTVIKGRIGLHISVVISRCCG